MIKKISILILFFICFQCLFAVSDYYKLSIVSISKDSDSVRYTFDCASWDETTDDYIVLSKEQISEGRVALQIEKSGILQEPFEVSLSFIEENVKSVDLKWNLVQGKAGEMEWSRDTEEWTTITEAETLMINDVHVGELVLLYLRNPENGKDSNPAMVGFAVLSSRENYKSYPMFSVEGGALFSLRENRFPNETPMVSKGAIGAWMDLSVILNDWFALSMGGSYERHEYTPFAFNEVVGSIKAKFMLHNSSAFTPFASLYIADGYFWNENDSAFNPSLGLSFGSEYRMTNVLSLLISADYSATFTHDSLLNPGSLIDSINHRFGIKVGCAFTFGKGASL